MSRPMKPKSRVELAMQREIVRRFRLAVASERAVILGNLNDAARSPGVGADMKARGLVVGRADLEVLTSTGTLFLELKEPGREQSEAQRGFETTISTISGPRAYLVVHRRSRGLRGDARVRRRDRRGGRVMTDPCFVLRAVPEARRQDYYENVGLLFLQRGASVDLPKSSRGILGTVVFSALPLPIVNDAGEVEARAILCAYEKRRKP